MPNSQNCSKNEPSLVCKSGFINLQGLYKCTLVRTHLASRVRNPSQIGSSSKRNSWILVIEKLERWERLGFRHGWVRVL